MRPKLKWVPMSYLLIDDRYQRDISPDRLRKMIGHFDERRLTPLSVSKRAENRYAVMLGQHRYEMLAAIGWKNAPCFVHEGLTAEEESELFDSEKFDRKDLTQHDIWKSELFRKEEPTFTINRIVEEEGFHVANSSADDAIRSVESIRRTYRLYGEEGLRSALQMVRVWDGMPRGRDGYVIEGVAMLMKTADPKAFSRARLKKVLQREDPMMITVRAATRQRTMGGHAGGRARAIRDELLGIYNKGLRVGRLYLVGYDADDMVDEEEDEAAA